MTNTLTSREIFERGSALARLELEEEETNHTPSTLLICFAGNIFLNF
jgi:hypothetical protein